MLCGGLGAGSARRRPCAATGSHLVALRASRPLGRAFSPLLLPQYNPSDFSIKAAQIECVLLQGRAQDALEEARAITAAAPHVAKAWQVEGAALEKLGQLRPAVERYQKAASVAESTGKEPALLEVRARQGSRGAWRPDNRGGVSPTFAEAPAI